MESNKSSELKVGVLVSLGILVLMITIIFLGGDKKVFAKKYHLFVKLNQVQGLDTGSIVQLLGVNIGSIYSISLIDENGKHSLLVDLELEKKYQKNIPEGSIAGVRTQGALGDKYILLTPGSANNQPIQDRGYIKAETANGFFETLAENTEKFEKIFDAIQELSSLMKNLNAGGRSALLMENLIDSSENLKKLTAEGHLVFKELRTSGAAEKLGSILGKIDGGVGTLGGLVNDSSVYEGLKQYIGNNPKNKYFKNLIRDTIKSGER